MSLAFRRAEEPDRPFIVDSWLESYRTAHAAGLIAMEDWRSVMGAQFERVLARPRVETFVAHHPGEVDHVADLYGWIAVERGHTLPYVLYVYVKQPYRRMGIARGLFGAAGVKPDAPFHHACKTAVLSDLKTKIPFARFSPLAVRYAPE